MHLRLMPIAAAVLALAFASGAVQAQSKAKRDAAMNALDTAERERVASEDVLRQMEEEQNTEEEARNE